ncbi:MAG TPA: hypothetical protein VK420_16885 [Longimicrobium sp.]|nr:hypothetical protein [Longimicrobium sp.]
MWRRILERGAAATRGKQLRNQGFVDELARDLPPLQARVWRRPLAALAGRVGGVDAAEGAERTVALCARVLAVLPDLEREGEDLQQRFDTLAGAYAKLTSGKERHLLLREYLHQTVADPVRRAGDVLALRRFLGLDALRERTQRARRKLEVQRELAVLFLAGAAERLLSTGDGAARAVAGTLVREHGLLRALALEAERPRAVDRVALARALARVVRALASLQLVPLAGPEVERLARSWARGGAAGPWVEGPALEMLLVLAPEEGRALLEARLLSPERKTVRDDFLLRRQALGLVLRTFTLAESAPLLAGLGADREASEHVRMGACEELARRPEPEVVGLLRPFAGLGGAVPEPSPKVRASAIVALCRWAVSGEPAAARLEQALPLLSAFLRVERYPLPLRIACEELSALSEGLAPRQPPPAALGELVGALEALMAEPSLPAGTHEEAAAALAALTRWTEAGEREAADFLAGVAKGMRPRSRRRLRAGELPRALVERLEDPAVLGRILAHLSRRDFGLSLQRERDGGLVLWRGEQHQRRLWRVLHELRGLRPDKRQAFEHTTGRVMTGELRAHPGQLHEVTPTQVPGERVHVDQEGGWGRHLPLVDDLLDLPLFGDGPVHVASSHGLTRVSPPEGFWPRLRNRLRISVRYPELSALRLTSLQGTEPHERRRYAEQLESELGIRLSFTPYRGPSGGAPRPSPWLDALLPAGREGEERLGGLMALPFAGEVAHFFSQHQHYFFSQGGNGPGALVLATAGMFGLFLAEAYRKRRRIHWAREQLPLCIGGWGTRGKSGTERLKGALFDGLGFEVFAKTTGSEAMFVHSVPGGGLAELFIYRPYDKATIWEQHDMVELGALLGCEVFLWECMALNPAYVELLQLDWMRDDLVTLTNAYPDHEDVQGPAGADVADVITRFLPERGVAFSSEDNFLPLFQLRAADRATRLVHVERREAELLPSELLARFPYDEHPRNIALVARLAEHLGIDRTYAITLMADRVVPEIGGLKQYPPARVAGRTLSFINGHAANERTGFRNNWRHMGLDRLDPALDSEHVVLTVVNNRWDRLARSQVFARILVEEAAADGHVLIGTNLCGLMELIQEALDVHVETLEVLTPEDLSLSGADRAQATRRLEGHFARLRVPPPAPEQALRRLERYAAGAGLAMRRERSAALSSALAERLAASGPMLLEPALEALRQDAALAALLDEALAEAEPSPAAEVLAPAAREEVVSHFLAALAKLVVHARLLRALREVPAGAGEGGRESLHTAFRDAYRSIFLAQVIPIWSPAATGDQIIVQCARAVPPGTSALIMGAQNIKGTGLDWVYRWMALDKVSGALERLGSAEPEIRGGALDALERFEDHGLMDTGLARAVLPGLVERARGREAERLRALLAKVEALHAERVAGLAVRRGQDRLSRWLGGVEKGVDYLDAIFRRRRSEQVMRDLADERISHARAAMEMRHLHDRQKGGWLEERIRPE